MELVDNFYEGVWPSAVSKAWFQTDHSGRKTGFFGQRLKGPIKKQPFFFWISHRQLQKCSS